MEKCVQESKKKKGAEEDQLIVMDNEHATAQHIRFLIDKYKPARFSVDLFSVDKGIQYGTMTYLDNRWKIDMIVDESTLCFYYCTEPHESFVDDLDIKWRYQISATLEDEESGEEEDDLEDDDSEDDDLEDDDSEEDDSEDDDSESYYDPEHERILRKLNKLGDNLDGLAAVKGLAHALGDDALLRITDDGTPGVEVIHEVADFNWAYQVGVNNADIVTPYHVFIPFCDGFFTDDELAALDRLGAVDERTEAMKKLNKYVSDRGGVDEEERRELLKLIN